jgi:hypothetical protein
VTYAECQLGFPAKGFTWVQGYSRGMDALERGASDRAQELGIHPTASLRGLWHQFNECGLHEPYREWVRLLEAGVAGRKPYS